MDARSGYEDSISKIFAIINWLDFSFSQKFSYKKKKLSDEYQFLYATFLSCVADDREPLDVELLVDSEIGTFARGRAWHSGQEVEELADGSVRVRFRTTQRRELVRWVLGQGHTVRVLAPPALVAEIRAEIDRVRGMYER